MPVGFPGGSGSGPLAPDGSEAPLPPLSWIPWDTSVNKTGKEDHILLEFAFCWEEADTNSLLRNNVMPGGRNCLAGKRICRRQGGRRHRWRVRPTRSQEGLTEAADTERWPRARKVLSHLTLQGESREQRGQQVGERAGWGTRDSYRASGGRRGAPPAESLNVLFFILFGRQKRQMEELLPQGYVESKPGGSPELQWVLPCWWQRPVRLRHQPLAAQTAHQQEAGRSGAQAPDGMWASTWA